MPFDLSLRKRLFKADVWHQLGDYQTEPEHLGMAMWPRAADSVTQMSLWDLYMYLPDDILVKVDRASMAFALEIRAPLLDHRIVEFAFCHIPPRLKIARGKTRILQRRLGEKLLPKELNLNRKQGFVMPIHDWLVGPWADPALEVLTSGKMKELFNTEFICEMVLAMRKGYTNGVRIFSLLLFSLWMNGLRPSLGDALTSSSIHTSKDPATLH
jgi:asparagine synthase (glutamine-hydrolysing)